MGSPSEIQISASKVLQIVQRHFLESDENNLKIISYEFRPFSNETQGFLANHRFLHVLAKQRTQDGVTHEHKLKFFTKLAPIQNPSLANYVNEFNVFEKECSVYSLLLPRLQAVNIKVDFAAKCFMARKDIIVFENLAEKGFRLGATAGTILDYHHLQCTLKSLASMHSASIVLESRMKASLPILYPLCVVENSYPEEHKNLRCDYVKLTIKTICSFIPLIPKYKSFVDLEGIIEKFEGVLHKIFHFVRTSTKYRNVFSHGDLWANNLLFRYERSNEDLILPTECKLVDFQLARYAPPALDILTVLTIPTTSEFRRKHLNNLLEIYYNYLDHFLADHSINIDEEISKKDFWNSVEYYKLAGLIESVLFCHITLLPPEMANNLCNGPDGFERFLTLDRINLCTQAFQTDRIYRERLTDTISEIIDNYVIHAGQ